MIVLDIETTGTDPNKHAIVSIGAVDMDDIGSNFYEECRIFEGAHIEPEALVVNGFSEAEIRDETKLEEGQAVRNFLGWLESRKSKLIAAQNPIFDLGFIISAAHRHHIDLKIAHRSIDLHSLVYFHHIRQNIEFPTKDGKSDMNSDKIMAYVGIPPEPKPHVAINGAIWEAEAISRLVFDRKLFEQFSKFPIPWVKG